MKRAKRMILVPEDVFNRFEQKQRLETSPIASNMMQKDTEMSKLLYREDLNDNEMDMTLESIIRAFQTISVFYPFG